MELARVNVSTRVGAIAAIVYRDTSSTEEAVKVGLIDFHELCQSEYVTGSVKK